MQLNGSDFAVYSWKKRIVLGSVSFFVREDLFSNHGVSAEGDSFRNIACQSAFVGVELCPLHSNISSFALLSLPRPPNPLPPSLPERLPMSSAVFEILEAQGQT